MASFSSSTTLLVFLLFLHFSLSISISSSSSLNSSKANLSSTNTNIKKNSTFFTKPTNTNTLPSINPKKKPNFASKFSKTSTFSSSTSSDDSVQPLPKPKSQKKPTFADAKSTNTNISHSTKPNKKPNFDSKSSKGSTSSEEQIPNSSKAETIAPKNNSKISQSLPKSKKNPNLESKSTNTHIVPVLDDEIDGQDLISDFHDFPSHFLPDLEKISTTSQAYLRKYNKEIANSVKPFVGTKYAPKIASIVSILFLILPLLLVTAFFHQLKTHLSLQRVLMLIQAYLAIYFATLSVTGAVIGFEPLTFFHATAPETYTWTQAMQTLGYVTYLIVQMINLIAVFSSPDSEITGGTRALGLAQMVVGLAVGLHYYMTVFHRAVTGEPPRANWKVHGIYALGFLVISVLASVDRRKKVHLPVGGDYGKNR